MNPIPAHVMYLIGEPGVGKTTAMRQVTKAYSRAPIFQDDLCPRELLFAKAVHLVAVELGKQRGTFSGTDALAMNIIDRAERYMTELPDNPPFVLAEGARLANKRFLSHCVSVGHRVQLLYLDSPQLAYNQRALRELRTGKKQNESWVKGRASAAANLADNPPEGVEVLRFRSQRRVIDHMAGQLTTFQNQVM